MKILTVWRILSAKVYLLHAFAQQVCTRLKNANKTILQFQVNEVNIFFKSQTISDIISFIIYAPSSKFGAEGLFDYINPSMQRVLNLSDLKAGQTQLTLVEFEV